MRSSSTTIQPGIIWLTGLSGSGKSTLAEALHQRLGRAGISSVVLDGDAMRATLNADLGFSREDRAENVRRIGEVAVMMAEAGLLVIVAVISPFRADRLRVAEHARDRGFPFAEIYINASLQVCERRDPKSLYRRARAGEIPLFTGIDSPYEPPSQPALEIATEGEEVEASTHRLFQLALSMSRGSLAKHVA